MVKNEIWLPIKGYEWLYQVSSFWRVMWRNGKILKLWRHLQWYLWINLCNWNTKHTVVHRLVAQTFIANPDNKRTVNHKDWNKTNNFIDNLERATYSENIKHSFNELTRKISRPMLWRTGVHSPYSKKVWQYDLQWNLIKERDCMRDIERELWFCHVNISYCCKWKAQTVCWYKRRLI